MSSRSPGSAAHHSASSWARSWVPLTSAAGNAGRHDDVAASGHGLERLGGDDLRLKDVRDHDARARSMITASPKIDSPAHGV